MISTKTPVKVDSHGSAIQGDKVNIFSPNLAVVSRKGPTIMLASGRRFDLLDPASSQFEVEDIAHGLAHICRYAGQCRTFYSVAEHSMLVSEVVENFALEALMHDAAEAFIGDITRPLKQLLPDYKVIEADIERVIADRFGLVSEAKKVVKEADLQVLAAEQCQVMAPGCADWAEEAGIEPAAVIIRGMLPEEAKTKFLARYHELRR